MMAERLQAITAAAGVPVHLQVVLRQGQPVVGATPTGARASRRACAFCGRVKEVTGLAGALRRARRRREVGPAAEILDVLQVPAFLCRQTDLLLACARSGRPVNVKKGQFLAPRDMGNVVEKIRSAGSEDILLTERGTSFGYNNLVVDFRGPADHARIRLSRDLRRHALGAAPGRAGRPLRAASASTCQALARAAVAVGVDALFMEIHEDPDRTLAGRPPAVRRPEHAAPRRPAAPARRDRGDRRGRAVRRDGRRAAPGARRARAAHRGRGGARPDPAARRALRRRRSSCCTGARGA